MEIKVKTCVHNADKISSNTTVKINSSILKAKSSKWDCSKSIAYPPFINSHEHLIGNWVPRAGENHPYITTDIWVEEMKKSESFIERNKVFTHNGSFDLTRGNANLLAFLGIYKNIFSGCPVVQDHAPNQKEAYYANFPIEVIKDYKQCHSLSMGNWWGGKSAQEEWKESKGIMPFILHLAEGKDESAKSDFRKLEELGLLQPNTLIIHGIALTPEEIKKCAQKGVSICCCPDSNVFLIGKTIDLKSCIKYGVNLVLGTDSTMSGSINMLAEIKFTANKYTFLSSKELYRMITENAQKALFLPESYGKVELNTPHLMLVKNIKDDPFENILDLKTKDIELLIHRGIPLYGTRKFLDDFDINPEDYFFFKIGNEDKFVIGHPEKICAKIDAMLGYHKDFPYLPF